MDGKDDLDTYLQRLERFAETAKWHKTGWASKLSALLSGQALEVYSRLSEEAAKDYDKVKIALMKRYDFTEDGYCRKFRASKPEVDESLDQFIVQLDRYLLRWLELSDTERTFDGLKELIEKEQFIDSCPKDLAIHLRERVSETVAIIGSLSSSWMNSPIPSLLLHLWQNESLCETICMKIHVTCIFIHMKIISFSYETFNTSTHSEKEANGNSKWK